MAATILRLLEDILQPSGYKVLKAAFAEAALEIAKTSHTPIDLFVTHVIMTTMNGMELAETKQDSLQHKFKRLKIKMGLTMLNQSDPFP
jgi:PleD family two-component response regulator